MAFFKLLLPLLVCMLLAFASANPLFGIGQSKAHSEAESDSKTIGAGLGVPVLGQIFNIQATKTHSKATADAESEQQLFA